MRLETVPLILGAIVALIGVGIVFDAWTPDEIVVSRERRRRPRAERHRGGEALIGIGIIALASEFLGRDTWNYSTYAVLLGVVLLIWGAVLNRHFLAELFTNRGPLRRREPGEGALPGAERAESPLDREAPIETLPGDAPEPPEADPGHTPKGPASTRLRIR